MFTEIKDIFSNKGMNHFYISYSIRSFALSLITLFIPLYLLKLNYAIKEIFLFFAIGYLVHILILIPVVFLAKKIGIIKTMLTSIIFIISFYFALYNIQTYELSIPFVAILFGLNSSLFWTSYHLYIANKGSSKNNGKELGMLKNFSSICSALGPVIGGMLLFLINFKFLFIISSFLLLFSIYPLFKVNEIYLYYTFNFKKIFLTQKIGDYFALIGFGIENHADEVMWPIFIFISVISSYQLFGFLFSFTFMISIFFTYFIGYYTDKNKNKLLKIGAILNSINWILRIFSKTTLTIFLVNISAKISDSITNISFDAICYEKARNQGIVNFIIFREFFILIGTVFVYSLMYFYPNFIMLFIISATVSLFYLFF
ncbi:MAG: MFS transporter [Nanoarchaeales archaeon]|nr:MFS transporter [Nanoarchaeales archaeon]